MCIRDRLDVIWKLEQAQADQNYVRIRYRKIKNREIVERKVKPVGIMFSEFYFYMTAFIEGLDKEKEFQNPEDIYPTIYRLDRLINKRCQDVYKRQSLSISNGAKKILTK